MTMTIRTTTMTTIATDYPVRRGNGINVLVVENDESVVSTVRQGLESEGFQVDAVPDGESALRLGAESDYRVILLNRFLQEADGRQICRTLRNQGVSTPILMLSLFDSVDDRVSALRTGADDYLSMPFDPRELTAKIEALMRRGRHFNDSINETRHGDLVVNTSTREVRRGTSRISLTPREFALLEFLMSEPGRVFSKRQIQEHVWGYESDPLTNVVEVYIRHLRRKIDEPFPDKLIHTVRGFGYKLLMETP